MINDPKLRKYIEQRVEETQEQRQQVLSHLKRKDWLGMAPIREAPRRLMQKGYDVAARRIEEIVARNESDADIAREASAISDEIKRNFEAIVGTSQILSANFLERGTRASRSVGRIVTAPGRAADGTGFLVSRDVLITNAHVIGNAEDAGNHIVQFNYSAPGSGANITPVEFRFQAQRLFLLSPPEELDYALIAVEPVNASGAELASFGWNVLTPRADEVDIGERVNIVHHPGGSPKRVSLRQNFIAARTDEFLHYMTDTEPGSSGSPVFDDEWQVVALHHASLTIDDEEEAELFRDALAALPAERPSTDEPVIVNEGARIGKLIDELRDRSPSLEGEGRRLLDTVLAAEVPPDVATSSVQSAAAVITGTGVEIPLRFNIMIGSGMAGSSVAVPRISAGHTDFELFKPDPAHEKSVLQGLQALQSAREADYLPSDAEITQRQLDYYENIISDVENDAVTPEDLYRRLADLLQETLEIAGDFPEPLADFESLFPGGSLESLQLEDLSYDRARAHLYTHVDLQEDRMLRCVYTDSVIAPEQLLLKDVLTDLGHRTELPRRFRNNQYLNCEHIVPQSWFDEERLAKCDLHHLISADGAANNFRRDCVYRELDGAGQQGPSSRPNYMAAAGRKESSAKRFEPARSKPVVARATLYFLLAHEGKIDATRYDADAINMLVRWANSAPPSDYERHRNETIFVIQGNRNPLIDFPQWADLIAFERGLS
jgi:endonuclease I/V8-like Glu-specific endopeptidase